mmetsp:Transcript_32702/g.104249  ORF Transcript_32702/g.104249 Transcript_32702/m.104249 type:complete len:206 (-) Transcript_32702:301-918(-)|eukprot:CAMPEP_0118889092 /NCGR_PEP_ID=MMETSP1166-20130328/185_1 /TAXON_ID=1104430 /ORGANISM="Chrysoreinhardia sp, Strain CCMP3193" /LENGTH=205 /DNA_ID=CAMNT_0006827677 /DNA_START=44 /DNA_END=661 /DNA_ORIENTATION=-
MTDCTFGFVGQKHKFVVVAADRSAARSIVVFKQDEDKVLELDASKLLGSAGSAPDGVAFTEFIQKNVALYEIDNGTRLDTFATANFIRNELAQALRRGPYQTNLLLGGLDRESPLYADDEASLYYIDYLASSNKVNFGCHGYASNFILSIFDKEWHPDLTVDQAKDLVQKCIDELQKRFLINLPAFTVKVLDKDGIRNLPLAANE